MTEEPPVIEQVGEPERVAGQEPLPDPRAELDPPEGPSNTFRHHQSARMDQLTWAAILVWAGVVLLLDNVGLLSQLFKRLNLPEVPWALPVSAEVWTLFFLGLGVILLLGVILRLTVPAFRHDVLGNAILTIVAFAVGLGRAEVIWPLILIAIGLAVIFRR